MFKVEPLSPVCILSRVDFWVRGTVLTTGITLYVDMRKITIYHELCLDLCFCVGIFGPVSLHWRPSGLVGNLVINNHPWAVVVFASVDQ